MGDGAVGEVLGGCRIEEELGRGGMGVVYRARQIELDRVVALKVIAPERLGDEGALSRFLREARAAASVDHPNVLPVHAAGVDDGRAYLVTRHVGGRDLETLVRLEGPLAPGKAAEVVGAAGAGLDAIHAAGLVHRDIKPANVLVDQVGHVWVGDFGLARKQAATSGLTDPGSWVGTADFAAPEQIRGERVDARTDVYALGCVLVFVLTGRVPFARESQSATLWAHLADPPPRLGGELAAFDPVVARALAKAPGDRFASAGELAAAAREAAAGGWSGSATVESPQAAPSHGPAHPRRGLAAAGGAVAVLALSGAVWLTASGDSEEPSATPTPTPAPTAQPRPTPAPEGQNFVTEEIRGVGRHPRGIAVAGGDVWVVSLRAGRLARVDAARPETVEPAAPVGREANDIAVDGNRLWVTNPAENQVHEADASTGELVGGFDVAWPVAIAVDSQGLWVVQRGISLTERDEQPGTPDYLLHLARDGTPLRAPIAIDEGIRAFTVGGGALWIALWDSPLVLKLDKAGNVLKPFPTVQGANYLAYGAGRLWASVPTTSTVLELRPDAPSRPYRVPREPAGIAVLGDRVYVARKGAASVRVLWAGRPRRQPDDVPVALSPVDVVAGAGAVWTTSITARTGALTRITPP